MCLCFCPFSLNIVWLVDFWLMINSIVSSKMFSYECLLQCFTIYFAILFILLKTNANVIIENFN